MRKDLINPNYYYVVLGWPLGKVCYFYLMSRSYMRHGGITVSEIEKLLHSECITFYKEATTLMVGIRFCIIALGCNN